MDADFKKNLMFFLRFSLCVVITMAVQTLFRNGSMGCEFAGDVIMALLFWPAWTRYGQIIDDFKEMM